MSKVTLEVVTILRKCNSCSNWKPLTHFFKYSSGARSRGLVTASLHICAACRGRKHRA